MLLSLVYLLPKRKNPFRLLILNHSLYSEAVVEVSIFQSA